MSENPSDLAIHLQVIADALVEVVPKLNPLERIGALSVAQECRDVLALLKKPRNAAAPTAVPCPICAAVNLPLEEVKRRYAHQVLESCGGNKRDAGRTLQVSFHTLTRLLNDSNGHP